MDELDLRNPEVNTQETISNLEAEAINIIDNYRIVSVKHLPKLKVLRAAGYCGVDQAGIEGLTELVELDISYNPKITDISFMTKLTKLKASGTCGIGSIPSSVTELDVSNNKTLSIGNLPHLKILRARGDCLVTPSDIGSLDYLDVSDNPNF
jgi:Leucine-rich repeat (LRR) protein